MLTAEKIKDFETYIDSLAEFNLKLNNADEEMGPPDTKKKKKVVFIKNLKI